MATTTLQLLVVTLVVFSQCVAARDIVVGQDQGGWTIGVKYAPINASPGDALVFNFKQGLHDVWQIPASTCVFDNGTRLSPPSVSQYNYTIKSTDAKTLYFACSTIGHCSAGQLLQVNVIPSNSTSTNTHPDSSTSTTTKDDGYCGAPSLNQTSGYLTVSCRSPPLSLQPGSNIAPEVIFPSPYPNDTTVLLRTISAEIVDETGRPVPLSEVYLHHIFGDYRFIPGEGAEIRHSPMHTALPGNYGYIVNGNDFLSRDSRAINFHVINTVGVSPENLKPCIECWCKGTDPPIGSIGCCSKCPSNSSAPAKNYYLQYNVSYSDSPEIVANTMPVLGVGMDVHGGVEYSVAPQGPNTTNVVTQRYSLDYFCPQDGPYGIVRCWAHQHIGAECITITDESTGTTICNSCPVYGTEEGVPGNEKGYVVKMSADTYETPYQLQPGQVVRVDAKYSSSQPFAGVMSMMAFAFSNFTAKPECNIEYAGFIMVCFIYLLLFACSSLCMHVLVVVGMNVVVW